MAATISSYKNSQQEEAFMAAYEKSLTLWTVPYETAYVLTKFGETLVIVSGKEDGKPLVLVPGAGDTSTMWYANAEALGAVYRIYAIDILGEWGKSKISSLPETRKDLADWMAETINGLGLEKPHIAGLSFGGFLTASFACYYPELIDKIVLLAPAATFQKFSMMFFIQGFSAMIFPFPSRVEGLLRWMIANGNEYDNAFHDQSMLCFGFGMPKLKVNPIVLSDAELKNIENSTLLLVGDQEVIYDGPKVIERAKQLIPNVQAEFVSQCGHHIPTEKPEYVNKRILDFLGQVVEANPSRTRRKLHLV